MAQEILFLRNATIFESHEAAVTALNGITHKVGQPVVAVYKETVEGTEVTKLLLAIGKAAATGKTSYETVATEADLSELVETATDLYGRFQLHEKAVAGSALGHIKAGGDIEIDETGVVTVPELENKANLESPEFTGTPLAPTAVAGTDTTQVATTAFVQKEINDKLEAANALKFKGTLGTDGTISELPEDAVVGDSYVAIEGAPEINGKALEAGDLVIFAGEGNWAVVQTNIDGAVIGPSSSVDGNIVVFDGATGKVIKDSGKTLSELAEKTTKVEAGEGLTGGGDLSADRTISHAEAPTTGEDAPVAEESTGTFITGIKVDKFGHVAEVEKGDFAESGKVKVNSTDAADYLESKFSAAEVSDNEVAVVFSKNDENKIVGKVSIDVIDGGTY